MSVDTQTTAVDNVRRQIDWPLNIAERVTLGEYWAEKHTSLQDQHATIVHGPRTYADLTEKELIVLETHTSCYGIAIAKAHLAVLYAARVTSEQQNTKNPVIPDIAGECDLKGHVPGTFYSVESLRAFEGQMNSYANALQVKLGTKFPMRQRECVAPRPPTIMP